MKFSAVILIRLKPKSAIPACRLTLQPIQYFFWKALSGFDVSAQSSISILPNHNGCQFKKNLPAKLTPQVCDTLYLFTKLTVRV